MSALLPVPTHPQHSLPTPTAYIWCSFLTWLPEAQQIITGGEAGLAHSKTNGPSSLVFCSACKTNELLTRYSAPRRRKKRRDKLKRRKITGREKGKERVNNMPVQKRACIKRQDWKRGRKGRGRTRVHWKSAKGQVTEKRNDSKRGEGRRARRMGTLKWREIRLTRAKTFFHSCS